MCATRRRPRDGRAAASRRTDCDLRACIANASSSSCPWQYEMLTAAERRALAAIGVPRNLRVRCYFNLHTTDGGANVVTGQWENGTYYIRLEVYSLGNQD
eukprot:COSAG02_NODE_491_length_21224_cov_5.973680_25_plen_100_part_00